ncbi:MAG: hypothetical protein NT140_01345 [Deltaproteobacteria bacterium]|nr:hypothetical protein [Deltaproteobacteria bacterium]
MESKLGRELFETQKVIATQVQAHHFLLCALLSVTDQRSLQRAKEILESQISSGEYQGLIGDGLQDALRIVSVFSDDGDPSDLRKMLRLIPGGK